MAGLSDFDFTRLPTTLDILMKVHEVLGYRLSLDHLAQNTTGAKKKAQIDSLALQVVATGRWIKSLSTAPRMCG